MQIGEPNFEGAKCATDDTDRYYPERGTAQITARDAKAVCNGLDGSAFVCPAREVCLEYALERKERFGIWGGKSERERARLARDRRIAAKKHEIEIELSRLRRAEAARRGWENRRRAAVEHQENEATKVVVIRTKGKRATEETSIRRRQRQSA